MAHYVLDYEKDQLISSMEAFNFDYSQVQKGISKCGRATWIFTLFVSLYKHKGKYDILHLHVLWWAGLLVGPWAKRENIPALYESVLLGEDTPSGIRKENFGKIKNRFLKDFKAILSISETLSEDYLRSGFSRTQVFTLMNCIDMEMFSPINSVIEKTLLRKKFNLPQNSVILLFVGSVIVRKGVDVLINALIDVISYHSDTYLLIVGPKVRDENPSLDEDFVNDINLLIKRKNISNNLFFTGLLQDRGKLADIYRACDIFVFPSRNEGLPSVVLEAMSTALPVVVSNLPGIEKVIKQGENGLIVPIGNADALRDSILTLSDDPNLAANMGASARNYIQENHGFLAWQSKMAGFYRGLL